MNHRIHVHAPAPVAATAVVDAGIGDFNAAAAATLADVQPLHVIASDERAAVLGGAIGRTWGACCELQQLWVHGESRGQGLGSALMDAFELHARQRGCRLVYLDTFSFQAPAFYRARGYQDVLVTAGFTGGVVKFTMHKTLQATR